MAVVTKKSARAEETHDPRPIGSGAGLRTTADGMDGLEPVMRSLASPENRPRHALDGERKESPAFLSRQVYAIAVHGGRRVARRHGRLPGNVTIGADRGGQSRRCVAPSGAARSAKLGPNRVARKGPAPRMLDNIMKTAASAVTQKQDRRGRIASRLQSLWRRAGGSRRLPSPKKLLST